MKPKCEFCERKLSNGYVARGKMYWCSQRHYLAWLSEKQRWEDEAGWSPRMEDDESMPVWRTEPIE